MIKSPTQLDERVPIEVDGIQINFCKNSQYPNFGVPASIKRQPRGKGSAENGRDTYNVVGSGRGTPMLRCVFCGQYPTIKNNKGIHEELIRFRCKACGRTFTIAALLPTSRHRKTHKNAAIFRLLVNKVPFRRICEVEGIAISTLYRKIDFIHRQCLSFAASRERHLPAMPLTRIYIGIDRQDYRIHWSYADDRRNIIFRAVGSADNTTGYIFGLHLNFDASLNPDDIERDAVNAGDYEVRPAYRRYARLWLRGDYIEAIKQTRAHIFDIHAGSLRGNMAATYEDIDKRADVEVIDNLNDDLTLPKEGMHVRGEYTMYGHFFFLRKLLDNTEKVRFFFDQDSAFRAACLSAFSDRIKKGRCDAFYVRINAEATIDEKRWILAENRRRMKTMKQLHPRSEGSADKTPDDKGEDGTGG